MLREVIRRSRKKTSTEKWLKKKNSPLVKGLAIRFGKPWPFKRIVMTYLQVKFCTYCRTTTKEFCGNCSNIFYID